MHSMSGAAPVLAYIYDLPLYAKTEREDDVAQLPERIKKDFREMQFDRPPGAYERFVAKMGGNIQKN